MERNEAEIESAATRLEIVQGLLMSKENADIMNLIETSGTANEAQRSLTQPPFSMTEVQAAGVLAMPLRFRTQSGRRNLEVEAGELRNRIG